MTWDGPNLPVDLTLTTASEPLTWTRSRLECSAWTLTALFAQVLTAIEPPKLFTSRRAPGRTGIVVYNFGGSDRKSTRLNSSHVRISYAVFCFKKKKKLYAGF